MKSAFKRVLFTTAATFFVVSGCSQLEQLKKTNDGKKDATPPAVPTVAFPSVTPYTHVGASDTIVIQGNAAFDTVVIKGPNGAEIFPVGAGWSYTYKMTPDSVAELKFTGMDVNGNISEPRIIVIRWFPTVSLPVAGAISGGSVTDVTTSYALGLNASVSNKSTIDSSTLFRAEFGLHRIVREMRASP